MKKLWGVLLCAALMFALAAPAFAGVWRYGSGGWWYDNQDGTYAAGGWKWIDGNGDGIAECYYFGNNGYLWTDARTPDGYLVNDDGQWIVNGVVQTKEIGGGYDPSSRIYSWMNGIYRADDGRTVTLDAAGGDQMCAALYCYSEDGWNTSYVSGKVDENTHSVIIYYDNGDGVVRGYYQLYMDGEAKDIWFQTYDLGGNYVGSWYDGTYSR